MNVNKIGQKNIFFFVKVFENWAKRQRSFNAIELKMREKYKTFDLKIM